MTPIRVPRWTISFADLALLLLCFFVMLQAGDRQRVAQGARAAFASEAVAGPLLDEPASTLFEPGEARLTAAARIRIYDLARAAGGRALAVESRGRDQAGSRFDGWELAAARTAALARALKEAGLSEERIAIVVAEEGVEQRAQRLTVRSP
jgi:flagellar motor protein MotB